MWLDICTVDIRHNCVISNSHLMQVRTHMLHKNVDTLMERYDLPRTGSAKCRMLSALLVAYA